MAVTDALTRQFDAWAARYDQDVRCAEWGFEGYRDGQEWVVRNALSDGCPVRIVDLGCGTARMADLFRDTGCEYIGIDLSPGMLAIASTRPGVAFCLQCDMRDVGDWMGCVQADRRTVVVSTYALHHFPDDEKMAMVEGILRRAPRNDLELLVVDYAFLHRSDREAVLGALHLQGRTDVTAEIESEHYADLEGLSAGLAERGLRLRYARNGIWDWRLRMDRLAVA